MADEFISKQRAKNLMECCLASTKAQYIAEKGGLKKARYGDYISTIQAMIDVVEAVEVADVQPVKRGLWVEKQNAIFTSKCSNCELAINENLTGIYNYCPHCGAKMDGGAENG